MRYAPWVLVVPGPVLRDRFGDVLEVTLVNHGTMPHSVDFHASQVVPDTAMGAIGPRKSLTYRFRADHAGVWLYHCAADPMWQHVANGMYGAAMIDPPGPESTPSAIGGEVVPR